jgi:hypothetical protein
MLQYTFVAGVLLLVNLFATLPLSAQTPAEPAYVLIVGTYHFANPGLDLIQTEVADVLSESKQAEIRAVVEAVARFEPTKIAVEHLPSTAPRLDSLYREYRAGQHELSRNETEQLGFRLAARSDHSRVFPIDHHGEFPIGPVMEYATEHDPAFMGLVQREMGRIAAEHNRQQQENTVGEILRLLNDPETLVAEHGLYVRTASVGAGDTYVGSNLLSKWYERNIRIHANLQRIAEPGDRIVVIVGSGHAPIMRELVTYDPEMVLVEAAAYLP